MSAAPRATASGEPPRGAGGDARYEFADADKESFRALAASVSFVGVCTMLFGALACVFGAGLLYFGFALYAGATSGLAALLLVIAWWMVSAGRSLSALVRTRGRDVEDLMEAVSQFRLLFGFARVAIVLVTLAAVGGVGLYVWCTLVADRGGKCLGPWG